MLLPLSALTNQISLSELGGVDCAKLVIPQTHDLCYKNNIKYNEKIIIKESSEKNFLNKISASEMNKS